MKNIVFVEPKLFPSADYTERFAFVGIDCPSCDGSGHVKLPTDYMGYNPADREPCQRCNGRGKLRAAVVVEWTPDYKERIDNG